MQQNSKEYVLKVNSPVEISTIKFELSEDDVYRMNMLEFEDGSIEHMKRKLTGLMRIRVPQGYNPHFKFRVNLHEGIPCLRISGNLFNFIEFVKAHKDILSDATISVVGNDKTAAAIITNSKSYRAPRNVEFERVLPDAVGDDEVVNDLIAELKNTLGGLSVEERKKAFEELKNQIPQLSVGASSVAPHRGLWAKRSK
jgi:hypothetical protein